MTDVLYIAGLGRSGSTILGNVLGEQDGLFHAGEVRHLWQRGLSEDRLCGCERPFSACPFWGDVLARAFRASTPELDLMRRFEKLVSNPRRSLGADPCSTPRLEGRSAACLEQLALLYGCIGEACGGAVVVDSSKSPYYLQALDRVPGLRIRVLHLVRDPRAVAFSYKRKRARPDAGVGSSMSRFRADRSARRWNERNAAVERVTDAAGHAKLLLRYEDFATAPKSSVQRVLTWLGMAAGLDRFGDGNTAELGENHGIWGNPSRFLRGPTAIRADEEWRDRMPLLDRLVVELLSRRTRKRYGY